MKKTKGVVSWVLGLLLFSFLLCAIVAVAENYPNFEFAQEQQEQQSSTTTTTTTTGSKSSSVEETVLEAKTATEFSKLKPNNYPNFAFTKSTPGGSKKEKQESVVDSSKADSAEEVQKPNNYPNFEFRTEDVKGFPSDAATTSFQRVPENKPNNYPNFEFRESTAVFSQQHQSLFDQLEKTAPADSTTTTTTTTPGSSVYRGSDVSGRFDSSFDVTNARLQAEARGTSTQGSGRDTSFATSATGYRGSDPYGRYPSSFDLTNARRHQAQSQSTLQTQQQRFSNKDLTTTSTSTTSSYRGSDASGRSFSSFDLTNARYNQASHSSSQHTGSQFSTESSASSSSTHRGSDPSGRYPSSFDLTNARHQTAGSQLRTSDKVFGEDSSAYRFNNVGNKYSSTQQLPDEETTTSSFPKFNYDTVQADTTTLAAADASQFTSSSTTAGSSGCSSSYWSSHTSRWPRFFTIYSKVTDAFPGAKVRIVYGTTTLLQALYDTRPDGYSQLLRHGVAALLNAYDITPPSHYEYSHATVIELVTSALASRTSAVQQAQQFENANTAYGTEGCNA
ncbi:unnamed protein product [Sphagnum compactum]